MFEEMSEEIKKKLEKIKSVTMEDAVVQWNRVPSEGREIPKRTGSNPGQVRGEIGHPLGVMVPK